jgi:uncharacterized membrane protein YraQ (UPF0718 family)
MALVMAGERRRIALMSALMLALALSFWTGSRYPVLNEKAIMGGVTNAEDPLTFDAYIQTQRGDPLYERVAISAINWGVENRQGMTFGFLVGAGFLTIFSLLPRRGTQNAFVNSLIGVATGAPLGVCVNCAAPIARGLHASGARIETTLSAMFSSPTLNIIVVTMLFSVFPVYLIVIKLGMTLLFLVLLVPLLARTVFKAEALATYDDSSCSIDVPTIAIDETWLESAKGTLLEYFKNLWYIVKTTLPLMILAGILAALVVHLVPLDEVASIPVSPFGVVAVALFGIFLPLPIALDIVIASALLAAGVPMIYVGTLLFTLGIYSVYSFSIVWTTLSARIAVVLVVVLMALGICAGLIAETVHQREMQVMLDSLSTF